MTPRPRPRSSRRWRSTPGSAPTRSRSRASRGVTSTDIRSAQAMDGVVKLLAVADRLDETRLSVWVGPTIIPRSHPLGSVHGAFNAVVVEADAAGQLMFYGQGAGGVPTASAVLGDVVTDLAQPRPGRARGGREQLRRRRGRSRRGRIHPIPPRRRRRRPARCPGRCCRRVRRPRCLHRDRAPGDSPTRRRRAGDRHAPGDEARPRPDGRATSATPPSCARSCPSLRVEAL